MIFNRTKTLSAAVVIVVTGMVYASSSKPMHVTNECEYVKTADASNGSKNVAIYNNGATNSGDLLRTTVWELVTDSGIPEKIPDGDIVFFKERKRLFRPHTKWTYQTSYRWVAIYSIPNLSIFPSTLTVGSLVSTELVFTTTVGSPFQSAFGITAEDITAGLHGNIRYKSKQIKPSSVTLSKRDNQSTHQTRLLSLSTCCHVLFV